METLVLVVLLEDQGFLVAVWISRVGHNILFGHATFGSDVFDTWRQVVEDDLDFAQSGDSFATALVAATGHPCGEAGLFSEHEGGGFVVGELVLH